MTRKLLPFLFALACVHLASPVLAGSKGFRYSAQLDTLVITGGAVHSSGLMIVPCGCRNGMTMLSARFYGSNSPKAVSDSLFRADRVFINMVAPSLGSATNITSRLRIKFYTATGDTMNQTIDYGAPYDEYISCDSIFVVPLSADSTRLQVRFLGDSRTR